MSLHAQLSPEALAALHRQKRNSTISSIVIAILSIVLIGLVLGFFLLDNYVRETPTIVTYAATLEEEQQVDERKVTTEIMRKPSSPSSAQAKVIAASSASPVSIPVPQIEVTTPSALFGDSDDFGFGFGDESGMGGGFQGIPSAMRKRCSPEDRLTRLRETGGTPECETAVEKGLEWLQSTQKPDGSWSSQHVAGYTGLGLLCYLGRCETPMSTKYGETVLRAITYLVDLGMKNDGKIAANVGAKHFPYEHSIAVYALAEAYTFCKQLGINIPNLEEVVQKSGQYLIDNQNANGGWAYSYQKQGGHVDSSVSAWQMQALKAMEYTGISFDGLVRSANRGVEYLETLQGESGGFGYKGVARGDGGGRGYFTMTGGCVLALQLWGKSNSSAVRNGAKYIEDHTKFDYDDTYADLYGHYYEIQVMMNRGGQQWKKYNELVRDELLANQDTDGSWKPVNTKGGKIRAVAPLFVGNVHYRTCLAMLMLESYYRFLPATGSVR